VYLMSRVANCLIRPSSNAGRSPPRVPVTHVGGLRAHRQLTVLS